MLKNNVEVDVKVKCIEGDVTQAKLAEEIGTSAPYVSRLIRNNEKIVNKTFLQLMEKLGYDVELVSRGSGGRVMWKGEDAAEVYFLEVVGRVGYDVELTYVKRGEE